MPEHRPLEPATPWVQVSATEADWDAAEDRLPEVRRHAGAADIGHGRSQAFPFG